MSIPEWIFHTNHAFVPSHLAKRTLSTAIEIATSIEITERAVRKIIADLNRTGYNDRTKQSRCLTYSINSHFPLRHHSHREYNIGDFLEALGWNRRTRSQRKITR